MAREASPVNEPAVLAGGFDGEATNYDEGFSATLSARIMRRDTHRLYGRYLHPGQSVLDIACGTGEDLVFLRGLGLEVGGLDISPQMLAHARKKLPDARFWQCDYNKLHQVDGPFDALCSNFGGLNTQSEFHHLASQWHAALKPGGLAFINLMTRWPLMEILEGLVSRRHAFRRVRAGGLQSLKVGGQMVHTWYFDPHHFYRQFFRGHFQLLKVRALGLFLPPPYLAVDRPRLTACLAALEKPFASLWPLNKLGDHAMLVLRARKL